MLESSDLPLTKMPLNNGAGYMPALGFGTLIPDTGVTKTATRDALAFLSMLRGNLYLEIALGCRAASAERDLESHTKSVVEVFLCGANRSVKFLEAHNAERKIQIREPEIAAKQFIGMIRADKHLAAMLTGKKFSTQHSKKIADNVSQTLMDGVITKGQQA